MKHSYVDQDLPGQCFSILCCGTNASFGQMLSLPVIRITVFDLLEKAVTGVIVCSKPLVASFIAICPPDYAL